jgi:hypothetical protein
VFDNPSQAVFFFMILEYLSTISPNFSLKGEQGLMRWFGDQA